MNYRVFSRSVKFLGFEQNSQQIINKIFIFQHQQTIWFLCAGEGGKGISSGSLDLSGLDWDDSTVGVSDESGVWESGDVWNSGVADGGWGDDTSGSGELGLGSSDSGLINGDNGTIGVGDQTSVGVTVGSGVWVSSNTGNIGIASVGVWSDHGVDGTTSGGKLGLGSGNGWLVSGD